MLNFNLDLFRPGDIIAVRNEGGFFGNNIQKKQARTRSAYGTLLFTSEQASYTHVELIVIRDTKDPNKFWSVRVAPPKAKLVDFPTFYKGKYIKIVRYKKYESFAKLKDVAIWAATHVDKPYDWPGIIKFLLVFIRQHTSWWFCAESCIWAFQQVYLGSFGGLVPHKSMPAHALLTKYTEQIWEGIVPE